MLRPRCSMTWPEHFGERRSRVRGHIDAVAEDWRRGLRRGSQLRAGILCPASSVSAKCAGLVRPAAHRASPCFPRSSCANLSSACIEQTDDPRSDAVAEQVLQLRRCWLPRVSTAPPRAGKHLVSSLSDAAIRACCESRWCDHQSCGDFRSLGCKRFAQGRAGASTICA